jgi:hypothetical protein
MNSYYSAHNFALYFKNNLGNLYFEDNYYNLYFYTAYKDSFIMLYLNILLSS